MPKIETVENQRIIRNNKAKMDTEHKYTKLNIEVTFDVLKDLTKYSEFKVWFYIAKNVDGYEFAFSSQHCAETTGLSKRTVQEAMRNLERLGYLVRSRDNSNKYDFYECPHPIEEEEDYSDFNITVHKA